MRGHARRGGGQMRTRRAWDERGPEDGLRDRGAPGKRTLTASMPAGSGAGAALPEAVRTRFEASLGSDLAGVRVHTGSESATAAASLGAQAFATGNDIHFADGKYHPDDPFGLH